MSVSVLEIYLRDKYILQKDISKRFGNYAVSHGQNIEQKYCYLYYTASWVG